MRITHRLSIFQEDEGALLSAGLDIGDYLLNQSPESSTIKITIDEDHPRFREIAALSSRISVLDIVETTFSSEELDSAANICFLSTSFSGYPEPSDDFGYREITYDLTDYCEACGIGFRQKAPFRMKGEMKKGRRTTTQMHWVFDEIFVRPETWRIVFEPFGIPYWPVHNRKGVPLESLVQLKIDALAELEVPAELPRKACRACGRVKYAHPERGYWPRPLTQPGPIFKSTQYFGDGHQAEREMFVSQELYQAMIQHRLNCRYWACASE